MRMHLHMTMQMQVLSSSSRDRGLPPLAQGFTDEDFDASAYVLPASLNRLAQEHAHETDARVSFDEGLHQYSFDGRCMRNSVTQLVERYCAPFDMAAAVFKMKKGDNWPRPEYTRRSGQPWGDGDITAFWKSSGECSRNRGTYMHHMIERHFNGLPTRVDTPEMQQFLAFEAAVMRGPQGQGQGQGQGGIQPWRTEWRVCAPELQLAGSVDFVGRLADGSFAIIDWKRSRKLKESLEPKKFRPRCVCVSLCLCLCQCLYLAHTLTLSLAHLPPSHRIPSTSSTPQAHAGPADALAGRRRDQVPPAAEPVPPSAADSLRYEREPHGAGRLLAATGGLLRAGGAAPGRGGGCGAGRAGAPGAGG